MLEPDFSALYAFTTLGFVTKKQAGYPIGGSQPIANTLENRYHQLGGTIELRAEVKKIIVQNNVAVGIQLEDGREEYADVVISAIDGFSTIYKHLDGKYLDRQIQERYATWKPTRPFMYASFGVATEFPDIPVAAEANLFELETPVMIAGNQQTNIGLRFHKIDHNFAPPGKTVFSAAIRTDYDYWKPLANDRKKYEQEKEKIKLAFIKALEQIWPGITAKIEMCDLVTPLTFERYTNNLQGSITGWSLIPKQAGVNIPKALPGLENFWMVGQWVYPGGGLPAGVITAREVVWRQCKKDKKEFVNV
jgi:phytoene dehydrogenase-like protein